MNSFACAYPSNPLISDALREAAAEVWFRNDWKEILYLDDFGAYYCASAEAFASSFLDDFFYNDPQAFADLISLSFECAVSDAVERYIVNNATVLTKLDPYGVLHAVFASTPDGDERDYLNLDETDDRRIGLIDWLSLAEMTPSDPEPEWLRAFKVGIPLYDIAISYDDCVLPCRDE